MNFSDYINQLRLKGDFLKAEVEIRKAISNPANSPYLADLYHLLAVVLCDQKKFDEAISCFQEALTFKPEEPVYLSNMAVCFKRKGKIDSAKKIFKHVLEISPDYAPALNNLANILKDEGKVEEAKLLYERALKLDPDSYEVKVNLALLFADRGELKKAKDMLLDVIKKEPDLYSARKALGIVCTRMGELSEAEIHIRYAILLNPSDPNLYSELGGLLSIIDPPCIKEAEDMLKKALSIDPECIHAYQNLAVLYSIKGEKEKAKSCYKKAIELDSKNTIIMRQLIQLVESSELESVLKKMHELEKDDLPAIYRIELFFALSEAYRKLGKEKEAFEYLLKANSLKRKTIEYRKDQIEKNVDTRIKVFRKENISELKRYGFPSEIPVFIVGMPRSGTTLMEAVLDSHPEIYGAGELKLFQEVMKTGIYVEGILFTAEEDGKKNFLKAPHGFFYIGMRYVTELRKLAPWAKRIVDKMPGNFFNIGLIVCSMPWAKIIHMKRHPMDTLLSCFEQPFTEGHEWTYELEELAHYYNNYFKLYRHWKDVFGDKILDVDYEAIVFNFKDEMKKVFDYIGVQWSEEISNFYKKKRVVKTASMEQVRKPLYSSSIGRWKRYEKYLEPLISNLSDDVKDEIKRVDELIKRLRMQSG